jgi:hypothetical protein
MIYKLRINSLPTDLPVTYSTLCSSPKKGTAHYNPSSVSLYMIRSFKFLNCFFSRDPNDNAAVEVK